jgi:hypothetical protein
MRSWGLNTKRFWTARWVTIEGLQDNGRCAACIGVLLVVGNGHKQHMRSESAAFYRGLAMASTAILRQYASRLEIVC